MQSRDRGIEGLNHICLFLPLFLQLLDNTSQISH